ncbi:hypothetical protein [Anabaena sp. FACHB-1237]|nr:hypothetical protein [Anabaena sp. FACHB-1237]
MSFALQPEVDTVIFGNTIILFDAYKNTGGTTLSLQGGVGLRF